LKESQQVSSFKEIQDRVAAALVSSGLEEEKAREVAFHMADWSDDLEELRRAWHNLGDINDEQLSDIIYAFLAHVPDHLAAAYKLIGYGPLADVFNVGIFEEDKGE
jgi:GH18 family chitinase